MSQCKLGVLGTLYDGAPQSALVGIAVTPKLEIVFDTVNTSRKFRNLIANSSCSFAIGWNGEQTVQYEGRAEQLFAPEMDYYRDIYFKAWPECRAHLAWPGIAYFIVRPTWIRYSDFSQNPPLIHEFSDF